MFMRLIHSGTRWSERTHVDSARDLESAGFQVMEVVKKADVFRFYARKPAAHS
jgi:hypothetical protein